MKTGLVLEGGAMRGMFTAGVTDVMMENDIKFDGLIGVSAGAVFGCNYKSGQIGRTIRYNLKFCRDKRYCSIRSLITTGNLYGADFCYHELPDKLDVYDKAAFLENPMEFHIVCTDVLTGKAVYRRCEDLEYNNLEWMRASASMPIASTIVEVDGYKLLDGGISDSIPLKYFEDSGYEKNVVILTQPLGYTKKKAELMPILRFAFRKYPNFIKALEERPQMYNDTVKYILEREKAGKAFVIRPKAKLQIGKAEHNADRLCVVYEEGRRAARRCLKDLKAFMEI